MTSLLRQTTAGLRVLLVLTVLTGVLYPLSVWLVSRLPGLHHQAEGSVVSVDGRAVGSDLIGVDLVPADPAHDPWFHTRPTTIADTTTSGASNKGAGDPDLLAAVAERRDAVARREGIAPDQVPADAVTASGSGLDPHISPAYAHLQAPRVARETGVPVETVRGLIREHTTGWFSAVNVLGLNLAVRAAGGGAN